MNFTYFDIIKKLSKLGYIFHRLGKGSHEFRIHTTTGKRVLICNHGKKTLSKGVINQIINSLGVTNKEFHEI